MRCAISGVAERVYFVEFSLFCSSENGATKHRFFIINKIQGRKQIRFQRHEFTEI